METLILGETEILTLHNVVYFILSTACAAALLNRSKLPNWPHMVWAIPASWIALAILFWFLGGLFKVAMALVILAAIGLVVYVYMKKPAA